MQTYAILNGGSIIELFFSADDIEALTYMLNAHGKDVPYVLFKLVSFKEKAN